MGSCAWNRHVSKELWHSKYLKHYVSFGNTFWDSQENGHSNVIFINNFKIYYREESVGFFSKSKPCDFEASPWIDFDSIYIITCVVYLMKLISFKHVHEKINITLS